MAEKDVFITCEVLDLFWDCLDEDILYNEFQEHRKWFGSGEQIRKTCYFGELFFFCSLLREEFCMFSTPLIFNLFQILI